MDNDGKEKKSRRAAIELSEKVIDTHPRLANTLVHEMCHVAAWLVDGVRNPAHGAMFWKWASIATGKHTLTLYITLFYLSHSLAYCDYEDGDHTDTTSISPSLSIRILHLPTTNH